MTIPSLARAAVDGDPACPAIDDSAREIEKVLLLGSPPEPNLDGHRNFDGRAHGFDDAPDAIGLAGECRAEALACEVIDRAAKVEIDEVGAASFDECCSPRELVWPIAGELDGEARLVRRPPDERE